MWGLNWPVYTGTHHPWGEPRVANRYRLTPISPQSFWNPKPRTYNRAFLPVCVSVFIRMLMILISRKKRKKIGGRRISRKKNTSVVHRGSGLEVAGNLTNRGASEFSYVNFSRRQKGQEQEGLAASIFQAVVRNEIDPAKETLARALAYLSLRPESREIVGDFLKLALRRR